METEARILLVEALKSAYWRMSDMNDATFAQSIDPLLSGISTEDRWALTEALYREWVKKEKGGHGTMRSLMELAWYVHP